LNIVVVGAGYVGLSNAILLAKHNNVVICDIDQAKVDLINAGKSPFADPDIERYLALPELRLEATTDPLSAYRGADYIIIATPTDYDPDTNRFNTSSVESVIVGVLTTDTAATMVIKSTVPVGFTERLSQELGCSNLIFSPEFLREGSALYDNLHPSRIVVGEQSDRAAIFGGLLKEGAEKEGVEVLLTNSAEAEAIKLFANTYLAMRVAFFNELDTYSLSKGLDSKQIINGVSLDPRIGDHYNNPSFGYGGYCLPKDSKQLLANFTDVPQNLINAVVTSNRTRKDFIADTIVKMNPSVVGIHRLVMKSGSDNFRSSSIKGIMRRLMAAGIEVILFEPEMHEKEHYGAEVTHDLASFKERCDVIVANRLSQDITDVADKVFTRDIFGNN
jgi:UDPglucose 6-dehydrogenase